MLEGYHGAGWKQQSIYARAIPTLQILVLEITSFKVKLPQLVDAQCLGVSRNHHGLGTRLSGLAQLARNRLAAIRSKHPGNERAALLHINGIPVNNLGASGSQLFDCLLQSARNGRRRLDQAVVPHDANLQLRW